MRNERAAGDSRHARTGKDGAFYSEDGVLLATVEQFTSNVNWNNAKYSVLGDAQEHETANTFAVNLTMSQIVVEDDEFIEALMEALETQIMPAWNFLAGTARKSVLSIRSASLPGRLTFRMLPWAM